MQLWLVRSATLVLEYAGKRLLVDPMLDPAEARPSIPNTANDHRNPLVDLPANVEELLANIDGLIVTHLHQDHLDETARDRLDRSLPLFGQPEDVDRLTLDGFSNLKTVDRDLIWEGISISRTPAQHGTGEIARLMAPVSGFILSAEGEPTLYLAGDTIWYEPVATVIASNRPEVIIVNGGGARFLQGDPIVMTAEDIAEVQRAAPWATVVVAHLEAINHCLETRDHIDGRLRELDARDRVIIPADGELVIFPHH